MAQKIIATISTCWLFVLAGCSITVEQTTLDFGSTSLSKSLTITIEGKLKWTIECDKDWVSFYPDHGKTSRVINVTVDRTGLDPGNYEALLTISNNWKIPPTEILIKMS